MKKRIITQKKLEKQIAILKNTSFVFNLATVFCAAIMVLTVPIGIITSNRHKSIQQEFIDTTPYVEFAENDYKEKVDELEKKIYNKEIPISEYDKELGKIEKITKEDYFKNYASNNDREKYNELIEAEKKGSETLLNTHMASVGGGCISTTIAATLLAIQQKKEEKQKKTKQKKTKQKKLNNPQRSFGGSEIEL